MRSVATARSRYSAALTQWTDAELEELFRIWMQVEKAAWKLQHRFSASTSALSTLVSVARWQTTSSRT